VERNAMELEKAGITPVVLRFASVYCSDCPDTQKLLRYAKFGYYMQAGPPDGFVPMVHADDAAKAVVEALKVPAGIWNVAEDVSLTRRESAQALATALGRSALGIPSAWIRNWAGPDVDITGESLKVSNLKFKTATTWKPNYISPKEGWKSVVIHADR
jgi:nucleoside-diphosphate-sugar epimerase